MTIPGFVIRNALRNKRRLLLSVLSAAVSLFLLVSLMVVLRELTQPPPDADAPPQQQVCVCLCGRGVCVRVCVCVCV